MNKYINTGPTYMTLSRMNCFQEDALDRVSVVALHVKPPPVILARPLGTSSCSSCPLPVQLPANDLGKVVKNGIFAVVMQRCLSLSKS